MSTKNSSIIGIISYMCTIKCSIRAEKIGGYEMGDLTLHGNQGGERSLIPENNSYFSNFPYFVW